MEVLHCYKTYFPDTVGGIEKAIFEICESTYPYGVTSEVFSLSSNIVERTSKIQHHTTIKCKSNFEIASTPFSFTAFYRFRQAAKKADIIHYHYPYPFADILHFACGIKKPSIVTYQSDIIKQKFLKCLYAPLKNRFLNAMDIVVSTSPNYFATSNTLKNYKNKTRIIPLGVNRENYHNPSDEDVTSWKRKLDEKFFLFIGACRYYKGLFTLIDAVAGTNIPIAIAGIGYLKDDLKKYATSKGVRNVHFLGQITDYDLSALLTACYGFVFPSHLRSEAFGVALVEAAMFGKPLISCEIGTGTTYINIDQETGIAVPPSDSSALQKAMQFLLDNPKVAQQMGAHAKKRYEKYFTANQMGKSYFELYQELVSAKV